MKAILETQRMLLREFDVADAPFFMELNASPEVLKYTGDKPFESLDLAKKFLLNYSEYQLHGMGRWLCVQKETFSPLGWCGLRYQTKTKEVDIGFRFLQKFWKMGFATEAAKACICYGFEKLHLNEIIGRAMVQNKASIVVLEKIGMNFIGNFDFELHPGVKYAILKNDYLQQQANAK
ncbi:MAG TPA: GNAT family N-acetyltransferase [Bacteroidia bacterium]|nr:GNAT family N-acetyltransferase [Bacteroidia bacterium]HRH07951.1 GNAT family N-acetyltransferase [Bacteroidia bacterium]